MRKILLTVAALGAVTATHAQTQARDAKTSAYWAAFGERDSIKGKALAVQFIKDYPIAKADLKADKAKGVDYHKIYYKLVTIPAGQINQNLQQYMAELPYLAVAELYYRTAVLYDKYQIEPTPVILERSSMLLEKLKTFKGKPPVDMPDANFEQRYNSDYYSATFSHAGFLKKAGRNEEALQYAEEANSFYNYKVADLNDLIVQLMMATGKQEAVKAVLEIAVRNNQSSPKMLELLKEQYKGDNFDAYLHSLKDEKATASLEEHIKSQLIKQQLPAFTVYDVNGKKVSSKDWKGKRVVLDFWASWCTPCKAAFPGMKLAQERLSKEQDVVFYFVVVHEREQGYKDKVKRYIADNHYPFNILFDGFADDKSSEEAAKLLNVTAIPHKMVLDKDGLLRFSVTGYYGSPSQLADEIEMMVKMVK